MLNYLHALSDYSHLIFIDSFNLNEKKKTIWIYSQNERNFKDDFVLLRDDAIIYILDTQKDIFIGEISFFIDHYIYIFLDRKKEAKIEYIVMLESSVIPIEGGEVFVPQGEIHELHYSKGLYVKKQI